MMGDKPVEQPNEAGQTPVNEPDIKVRQYKNVPNWWKLVPISCLLLSLFVAVCTAMVTINIFVVTLLVTNTMALLWNVLELTEFKQIEVK